MRKISILLAVGMVFSLVACGGGGGGGSSTYSISGTVTLNGTGYSGVTVDLSGNNSDSAITDTNGEYSFTDLEDGSYTVTPSLANQTLTPTDIASISVSGSNSTNNDFEVVTHSVSGRVTLNSSGYAGATVSLTGSAIAATTTPVSGNYTFDGLLNGTYTVTPTVSGQSLTPTDIASIPVSASDSTGNDFALVTHSVSGQVTLNSSGYAGATVSLTGSATASTTTPASGHYTFDGLLNGTYTVTPDVSSQSLAPTDIAAIPISGSDSASNDFALVAYSLSGRVTYDGFGESDVTVSLSGAAAAATTTDGTGDYSFTGLLNGTYTVTPSLYSQNFSPVSDTIVVSSTSQTGVDFTIPYLIWFIDKNSPTSTPDGMSWATAYTDPQTGADFASAGEQVWIAEGRYASMDTSDPTMPVLAMKEGVEFYGGFAGTETTISERDLSAHTTTLDGENLTLHVVIGADNATLDGFTVTQGNANDDSVSYGIYGGGMFNLNVSPTVTNCTFADNSATIDGGSGGGMFNLNSSPIVTNCMFTGNSASTSGAGGGMYNANSSPIIMNCTFTGNYGYRGGGMINLSNSSPIITNCTFTGNSGGWGGAVYSASSSPTITNSILWGNDAPGSPEIYGPTTVAYSNIEGGYFGINNINVDPLFYDPTFGGYRLGEMSPCLDVGNNSAVTTSYDLAGIDRIQNTTVDLGAYEGGFAYVPKTLYVDISSTNEPDGLTWGTAFQGLQETLAVAVSGDEIWVADGTYYPTDGTDRSISFQMVPGVALYGGFAGTEAARDQRNWTTNITTLSGDIGTLYDFDDNSAHVVVGANNATLDGFTVTQGNANDNSINYGIYGGGMYNNGSSPIVTNCYFVGNRASTYGGGMYNLNSSTTVTNTTFSGNPSFVWGGGMYNDNSSITVTNCIFRGNSATQYGGGMFNRRSSTTVVNSTFIYNSSNYGGGVLNTMSDPTFINCTFSGNSASAYGGGMYNDTSTTTITNCILWGNTAFGGPEIFDSNNVTVMTYSDISGGGYAGVGNIIADPRFVHTSNVQLTSTSPAIDAGDNTAVTTSYDLYGSVRILDGPDVDTTATVDMGAYEYLP